MSRKYKIWDQSYPYFVSFAVVHWIDLFVRPAYQNVLVESLRHCQKKKGLIIYGWCLMPSHMHMIIGTKRNAMEDILRDFKSYTSGQLKKVIQNNPQESRREWVLWMMKRAGLKNSNNNDWQLWQQHNHPIELSSNKMVDQRLNYLHQNPVKASFVEEPEHWKYSSAVNYCGGNGLLDVYLIE